MLKAALDELQKLQEATVERRHQQEAAGVASDIMREVRKLGRFPQRFTTPSTG